MDAPPEHYLQFHQRRYDFLVACVHEVVQTQKNFGRLLDIGLSYQTLLFQQAYPNATVDTLGFFDFRFTGMLRGQHINFDLNRAVDVEAWPAVEPYDVVVMAEVIEHLYVAPVRVLRFVSSLLRNGGTVLIQTPNPISLGKRISLLRGRSPFEIVREDANNPGHFCEYTPADLRRIAQEARLEVTQLRLNNYFGPQNRLYDVACRLLPGDLHDGITLALRKPHLD